MLIPDDAGSPLEKVMAHKVCKFGGSSLADAAQFLKVQAIIAADPQRCYVVPSAPGKRSKKDQKITDLLYLCHAHVQQSVPFDEVFNLIAERYVTIVRDLGLKLDIEWHLADVKTNIAAAAGNGDSADYAASRGEYLNGLIMAELLGYPFIDAAELIFFTPQGRLDEPRTYATVAQRLKDCPKAVIPGFYGSAADGRIKTLSRGGSDVTGAIVARGCMADIYENWTDVSGLLMADPNIVEQPHPIDVITYRELRELAYMGATVLHDEAIFPVRQASIPVQIRNTNRPDDAGTMIVGDQSPIAHTGTISGVAGRRDFTVILVEKAMMNAELGFGRRLLSVLESHGISYEHTPSGIDTMSVVIAQSQLDGKLPDVLESIRNECSPDNIEVYPNMALVATVGRGMARTPGVAARLFTALAQAQVNIRMIDQGSSELNIIVGVEARDFENAVRAIYHTFVD